MYYPAGIVGWKAVAKLGFPISTKFLIGFDDEAKVYFGKGAHLKGVFAEGETLEELFTNIKSAAHDILEIELDGKIVEINPEYKEVSSYAFL